MTDEPYHIRNADKVVRGYANTTLAEDRRVADEGEPIIEVGGEPLTVEMVDEAINEVFGDN